jgi:hypothetical protein
MTRKVTIEITDADGGFHLSIDVQPPLPEHGTVPEPSAALIAGMVARRAIEQLVAQQQQVEAPAQQQVDGGQCEAN